LSQLDALSGRLSQSQTSPTYLSLILLARSSKVLYSQNFQPLSLTSWEADLQASALPKLSLPQIAQYLSSAPENVILVDNTSSQEVADCYPLLLKKGINVVTPNKKGFSGSYSLWEDIFAAANALGGGLVFHESSVGAGLPVISTLKELVDTGDQVQRIEGVFSGTMSFLFNSFAPVGGAGGRFSEEVKKAKDLGYTVSTLLGSHPQKGISCQVNRLTAPLGARSQR
jgi:homoserine dehydrogenase